MSFDITDAVINQSGEKGSDFTLVNTDSIDDIFNGIEVKLNYYIDSVLNDINNTSLSNVISLK